MHGTKIIKQVQIIITIVINELIIHLFNNSILLLLVISFHIPVCTKE